MSRAHNGVVTSLLAIVLMAGVSCSRQQEAIAVDLQSEAEIEKQIDSLVIPLIEDEWARGIVVGVVTEHGSHVFRYGTQSAEEEAAPDGNSIFEIGSVTKAITGLILADMVVKGEVALDDPIGKYLQEGVSSPKKDGKEITLLELATHTSGLPLIPDSFWPEGANRYDPDESGAAWRGFSEEKLLSYLNDPKPPLAEKGKYVYSNLGAGLLGYLLTRAADKPYEQLLKERITEPLGMSSTAIELSEELQARLVQGHDPDLRPVKSWDPSVLEGAFAIRSSIEDMNKLMQAMLGLKETPLSEAIALASKGHFKRDQVQQTGLGWNRNVYEVVFHTGTTGGYRCATFLLPGRKLGVTIMCNTQVGGASDGRALLFESIAGSLLNVLVGVPPLPAPFPKEDRSVEVDPEEILGVYLAKEKDDDGLRIELTDGKLTALVPFHAVQRIYPSGKDKFFFKAYDIDLTFTRDESRKVNGADARIGENKVQLLRKPVGAE